MPATTRLHRTPLNRALADRYRCPESFAEALVAEPLSSDPSWFRFGDRIWCYGQHSSKHPPGSGQSCPDLNGDATVYQGRLLLPFDPTQIIENLRCEVYAHAANEGPAAAGPKGLSRRVYYSVRPLLPVSIRAVLQRIYLRDWNNISFPNWPVDVTVEDLLEKLLFLSMTAAQLDKVPFIWFWPDGAPSAAILTHDIESSAGRNFCGSLMDIDESFGFRSSFQVVPEERYDVSPSFLADIRSRGNNINIQDLNHDGYLFDNLIEFSSRVKRINQYGRKFGAKGFRSAVLYRNLNWYDRLEFDYDMSVPNVGHLEPQRGGCCTVFPYFIGHILELPVTTTQDYSLFHILREYSLDLWKAQTGIVEAKHGLLSFITHPDYLRESRAQKTYCALLAFLRQRSQERGTWVTTADEVNEWWRQRSQMKLVCQDGAWRIEGHSKERARIAYATKRGDSVVYSW